MGNWATWLKLITNKKAGEPKLNTTHTRTSATKNETDQMLGTQAGKKTETWGNDYTLSRILNYKTENKIMRRNKLE